MGLQRLNDHELSCKTTFLTKHAFWKNGLSNKTTFLTIQPFLAKRTSKTIGFNRLWWRNELFDNTYYYLLDLSLTLSETGEIQSFPTRPSGPFIIRDQGRQIQVRSRVGWLLFEVRGYESLLAFRQGGGCLIGEERIVSRGKSERQSKEVALYLGFPVTLRQV